MERIDLRDRIIPTILDNQNQHQKNGNKTFQTKDLIYIESYEDQINDNKTNDNKTNRERRTKATDYAIMNGAYVSPQGYIDSVLRTSFSRHSMYGVSTLGDRTRIDAVVPGIGICPCLHYKIPENLEELKSLNIMEVKNEDSVYHILQTGEYAKLNLSDDLSKELENLYNGGKIKEGLRPTGKWYTENGLRNDFAGKHNPEFEYKQKTYARVVSRPQEKNGKYSNGTETGKKGTVRWAKVEPISFIIKNWDDMPVWINPNGNGQATYFDLRAEDAIISSIPFYTNEQDENITMWQNSTIRGFLNGIDVRNITENGNPMHVAQNGGDFRGACNFLNEAFNLTREPIYEYEIPESETKVAENGFNGCVSLKRVILHNGVKDIGRKAFGGIDFKYAYRLKTGKLEFSTMMPEHDAKEIVELDRLAKAFENFDYNILIQNYTLTEIADFAKFLNKNKFTIPYVYAFNLAKDNKIKALETNTDFRFFRSEFPNINDMLKSYSDEEKLSFFKFASTLGCFSKEKIKDKNGKETQVFIGQKASSLLATILKMNEIKLRSIFRAI